MKKRIFKLFTLLVLILGFAFITVKANTNGLNMQEGAQIRTIGNQGLMFTASVDTLDGADGHGFYLAIGEHSAEEIQTAINNAVDKAKTTIDGNVLLQKPITGTGTTFKVVVINIPELSYGQEITAVSYVQVGETITVSDVAVTRSIGQVALNMAAAGDTNAVVEGVVNSLSTNYKNVRVDEFNNVYINSSVYETNPANLEKAFITDWNAKFGTSFTEYTYSAWQTSAKAGYGEGTGMTANGDTDCSGTNAYEFFITDAETSGKWRWLLTYFLEETNTVAHPKRQINALLNGGNYEDYSLQQFAHLSRSLQNFFDAKGTDVYSSGIDVIIKDFSVYHAIEEYNTTVYATDVNFVAINSEVELKELSNDGYTFDGYKEGANDPVKGNYTVTATSKFLAPKFTAEAYTITYYNASEELTTDGYTIEDSVILPENYELDGYKFEGWYDNEECTGDPITMIEKGSTGDKVYYGKFVEKEFVDVNITYNLDGGSILRYPSVDAAIADFLADYNTANGKSYTAKTFYQLGLWSEIDEAASFLYNLTYKTKWTWLVDYIAGVASEANKQAYKLFNNYNSLEDLISNESNNKYRIAYELRGWVGQTQYTQNANYKTADYSTDAVKEAYLTAVTLPTTYVYSDPITLPTPVKEGYKFEGWTDGSGNPVTQFPGYKENPGNLEYTANWSNQTIEVELSDADETAIASLKPDVVVNSTFVTGKWYSVDGVYYQYGVNAFATISEALVKEKEGQNIYVFAGTYAETLTISSINTTVYGPNYGIAGTENRNEEAVVQGVITISANNVTINGLALSGSSTGISLGAVSDIVLTNIYSTGYKTFTNINTIYSASAVKNLTISNSYISANVSGYRPIALSNVNGATITNNTIYDNEIGAGVGIAMNTIAGTITLTNNTLDYSTSNTTLYLGNTANTCNKILVRDNIFTGTKTATIDIRNVTTTLDFVGNTIENSTTGNNFNFRYSTGTINVKYNYFKDCTYKLTYSTTAVFENNCYSADPSSNLAATTGGKESCYTNDYTNNNIKSDTDALAEAYSADNTYNS